MIAVQFCVINEIIEDAEPIAAPEIRGGVDPMLLAPTNSAMSDGYTRAGAESHGVWRAFYRLTDINQQLTPYVEDVVRSEVPRKTLDQAYESKDDLANAVKAALQVEMKRYGYGAHSPTLLDYLGHLRCRHTPRPHPQHRLQLC